MAKTRSTVGAGRRRSRRRVPIQRRLRSFWDKMFSRGELTVLIIAIGLLLMPALSLEASGWPVRIGVVGSVLVLSVMFGFLLARSQYNEFLALMMSGIYGACFVMLAAAFSEPGGVVTGVYSVFERTVVWIYDATSGGINQDELVFTMIVATLFWFLGYNVSWHIFRFDQVFRVILPPGLIIIVNTVYYTGENDLRPYLIVYLFLSLLLVVRSYIETREWEWYQAGIRVPRKVRRQFNTAGASLALVAVAASWTPQLPEIQQRLDAFQQFMQSDPLLQASEVWNRLFSTIDAYGPVTADYYGGDSLELSGAIQLGDGTVMEIAAPPDRRYYWRSRVFDTYENGNWRSLALDRVRTSVAPFEVGQESYAIQSRQPVTQQVTMGLNASRLVYLAPQPASVDLTVISDLRFLDAEREAANIHVIRPARVLQRGDTYTATSLMSNATANELRAAGENYPQWVRDTQFYVPPSVTGRTLVLAREIVEQAGAVTPYDKAKAIERWLRANMAYNESIPAPPIGQDPIDWFLFDYREGYCNYYASAMIMMLRSQGIPARMGAGFAEGEWNGSQYVVRERDAHTWVEVYFPGYGWIEFEPTAAQQAINRGDETDEPVLPTATPAATNTPTETPTVTPTPTPSITPTPDPSDVPTQEDEEQTTEESFAFSTATATLTPTVTATPVIVPSQQPPLINEPPSGLLDFVLPAVITIMVGLLVIGLIVAIAFFVWWWWEWRGMRGLSPAVRAYARLERYLIGLLRMNIGGENTTFERRELIVQNLPRNAERPVTAITNMYTEERYGRGPETDGDVDRHAKTADKAWVRARENILSKYFWRFVPFRRYFNPED